MRAVITRCTVTKLSLLVLLACSTAIADDAALRDELITRVERDQEARWAAIAWGSEHGVNGIVDEDSLTEQEKGDHAALWAEVSGIDAENTAWLKNIVMEQGWPRYSIVGVDAGDAAWLLVQHADADPSFQRLCLDLMRELPADEMSQSSLAMLTDRVLLKEGKSQIYGTQFVVSDGEWVPLNLENIENVDVRRAEVGMPPLAEYKEMLEAMMRGEELE